MTGVELIEELARRGVDTTRATVKSTTLPELDENGRWVMPEAEAKSRIKITDGKVQVIERRVPVYPERWVVIGPWHIGPGGYRKNENFEGYLGVTKPRDHEVYLTDDLDELAELLVSLL